MIELERSGTKGEAKPVERVESGHLPPVHLEEPRPSEQTGWSPSEWRQDAKREPDER